MNTKTIVTNFGILASISWNSRKWAGNPTEKDLSASKYDFVKDNAHMHESLNFGHDKFPAEHDGYYIGYTPMFNRLPSVENSANVNIIFFNSSDYQNSNRKAIVGFYGFPMFGDWYKRTSKHSMYLNYDGGNIKAYPKDIIYLENPIIIDNDFVKSKKLLPDGKKISQQGFNYLNSNNVYNLIKLAVQQNPTDSKLNSFLSRFPQLVDFIQESNELNDFYEIIETGNADSVTGIVELERRMKNKTPEIKHRISGYIERGAIADKVKKITKQKCLICLELNLPSRSFLKKNGEYYIEVHHVEPVSTLKKGTLSINNLLTVCANHHRQLHYGKTKLLKQTDGCFIFQIDGERVEVKKIDVH